MRDENEFGRAAKVYFSRPAYRRMLEAVWKKYVSLGRIGGKAIVRNVSEAESEALNAFFGYNYTAGDHAEILLHKFEQELQESKFQMGMLELHMLLNGEPLITKMEQQRTHDDEWTEFFQALRESIHEELGHISEEWLHRLEQGIGAGYRTLRELYKLDQHSAMFIMQIVIRALNTIFMEAEMGRTPMVRLPVLSALCCGDAHALDSNQPAGRLLIAVLRDRLFGQAEQNEIEYENELVEAMEQEGSETLRLRELYRNFGIGDDDISSIVYWFVPASGMTVSPEVWTLRQVEQEEGIPRCSSIFIVENPAVFSTILDSIKLPMLSHKAPSALICTSGPASAAAIRWIQRSLSVSNADCKLHYSGDFDVKGISMGETLASLFPSKFTPWHFGGDTYQKYVGRNHGLAFDNLDLQKLQKQTVSWDHELAYLMAQTGFKVHQETFVEELVRDYTGYLGSWKEVERKP